MSKQWGLLGFIQNQLRVEDEGSSLYDIDIPDQEKQVIAKAKKLGLRFLKKNPKGVIDIIQDENFREICSPKNEHTTKLFSILDRYIKKNKVRIDDSAIYYHFIMALINSLELKDLYEQREKPSRLGTHRSQWQNVKSSVFDDPTKPLNLRERMGAAVNSTFGKNHVQVNDLDKAVKAEIDRLIPHALNRACRSAEGLEIDICYIQEAGSKIVSSLRNSFTRSTLVSSVVFSRNGDFHNLPGAVEFDSTDIRQRSYFFQQLKAAAANDPRFEVKKSVGIFRDRTTMGDKKVIITVKGNREKPSYEGWTFGGG